MIGDGNAEKERCVEWYLIIVKPVLKKAGFIIINIDT